MLVELAPELREALARVLSGFDRRSVGHRARALSERYRSHASAGRARFVRDELDAAAHAALLLPASHAQLLGAFSMLGGRAGSWRPRTVLDLGPGPGTVAWAVAEAWPEALERVVGVEREPAFLDLAARLAAASSHPAVRQARYVEGDVVDEPLPAGRFDLVVLSLVLSEVAPADRPRLLDRAFAACDGVVLVVEPGTPEGFAVVRAARDRLSGAGARTLAPCPHDDPCPLADDWCHFTQRLSRPEWQQRVKRASLPWEDAKYSFAAVSRFEPLHRPWARVLAPPRKAKGRVHVPLCAPDGISRPTVPKSRSIGYRLARKLDWGDAVSSPSDLGLDPAGE